MINGINVNSTVNGAANTLRPDLTGPVEIIGSASFGRVTTTRFPAGDSGSSRQNPLAVKFNFQEKFK